MTAVGTTELAAVAAEEREVVKTLVQTSAAVVVTSDADSVQASKVLTAIKTAQKTVKDRFAPIIESAHRAHKEALAMCSEVIAPLADAERRVKGALATYADQQRRLREEAERKRREEEARIERERREEEARIERERLASMDEAAANGASDAEVMAIAAQPVELPPAPVLPKAAPLPSLPPKVSGVTQARVWKCAVEDLAALVKAVASGAAPITLIEANMPAINANVRLMKGDTKIPGVRVWEETEIRASGR